MADRASGLDIRQTAFDHRREGELLNELFERTVVRLLADHPPELILGRGGATHPPLVEPEAIGRDCSAWPHPFLDFEALVWPLLDRDLVNERPGGISAVAGVSLDRKGGLIRLEFAGTVYEHGETFELVFARRARVTRFRRHARCPGDSAPVTVRPWIAFILVGEAP